MKQYQVIIQDEWDNLYHLGFYNKLSNSIKDINDYIKPITKFRLKAKDLKEYTGSFGMCFDKNLSELDSKLYGLQIRGFIFYGNKKDKLQ